LASKINSIGFQNQLHWISKSNPLDFVSNTSAIAREKGRDGVAPGAALSANTPRNGRNNAPAQNAAAHFWDVCFAWKRGGYARIWGGGKVWVSE
jgi:hypothetical protein